jgi:hypothetical protein
VQPAFDSDEDGLPDWKETLLGTDPHKYTVLDTPTSTSSTTPDSYTSPTSLTGRFAQYFFEDMARSGAGKTMTEEDKMALVSKSVTALTSEIKNVLYTQAEIKSVARNDAIALHIYGNDIGDIVVKNPVKNENELVILGRAVTGNNPKELEALGPIEHAYTVMLSDLLALETPSNLAKQHVDLINALSMVHTDIVAMQHVFDDPLGTLVLVKRYQDDITGLYYALHNIRAALETSDVVYTNEESGLYLFKF